MKFELNDLEIIAQTTSRHFKRLDGDMMSSLISSVTAFAFAAAKVGVEDDLSSDRGDSQSVLSIIDKFDSFMRIFGHSEFEISGLVDRASVEKGSNLIDNLIFNASIKFNNLSIRLQCPLELNSVNRACDLRLKFQRLEIDNIIDGSATKRASSSVSIPTSVQQEQSTEDTSQADSSENRGWSNWFTSWFSDHVNPTVEVDNSVQTADKSSVMTEKSIRLDGVTLHWDLWDTTKKEGGTVRSPSCGSVSEAESDDNTLSEWLLGPDAESMLASACLLSLPSEENYLTLQILHTRDRFSVMSIHPTLIDFSADLDCIFAALCPSQLFWLKATVTQLTKYFEAFCALQSDGNQEDTGSNANTLEIPSKSLNTVSSDESCAVSTDASTKEISPTPFSLSARFRLLSLTVFHDDEEACFPDPLPDPSSLEEECGSSSSEDHFHEALSSIQEPIFTSGTLKCQNALFSALEANQEGVKDLISSDRTSVSSVEWLESINPVLTKFIEGRDHLQLLIGHFELEFKEESHQTPPGDGDPDDAEKEMGFPSKGPFIGQIGGLLFSECLFSHGVANPTSEITKNNIASKDAFDRMLSLTAYDSGFLSLRVWMSRD
ncbi:hypothetical protein Aperf_G00000103607 [Anoplocephala perfoliata]